jgi:hypothetical protein
MATIAAQALGALILQIYAASRRGDVDGFQRRAIESVQHLVAPDSAWWGRGTSNGPAGQARCGLNR